MNANKIRILIVDADHQEAGAIPWQTSAVEGIEVLEVVDNLNAAQALVEELQPNVLVVDLILPGSGSIDFIRDVIGDYPQVHILALAPADPPHDQVMLAVEAGALGYICRDAKLSELRAAVEQVNQGEPWLPIRQTCEILQDGAGELVVTAQERRGRLTEVLLGVIPLTGLIAAITTYLWRHYWGAIGVRVSDLGVDPSTRMIDVLVVFLIIIAVAGPLLFVRPWVKALGKWITNRPPLASKVNKLRSLRIGKLPVGRLLTNFWVAWLLLVLVVLLITLSLVRTMPLIMVLVVGPGIAILLVANVLGLDDALPGLLHLPHLDSWRVLGFLGIILILFLLTLGAEVLIMGPDLRPDGLHGFLAPKVLGFSATPMILYDLDEKHEPLGALYLGGNADLYVLYDPCAETVRLVPVGASRVELVDRVECRSP